MEAANRGCQEEGGVSVGFNIDPARTSSGRNPYVEIALDFKHFYARKVMMVKAAEGFVIYPGGFGTMDELFESLTLIQTGKVEHFPVVLAGRRTSGQPLVELGHPGNWSGATSTARTSTCLRSSIPPTDAVAQVARVLPP